MLKFIGAGCDIYGTLHNFKTSYVEVYPDSSNCLLSTLYISKHLMLKFIRGRNPVGIFFHKFQNILCWSLSLTFGKCMIRCLHFKTSYVEVYPELKGSIKPIVYQFQNILCWSLSPHFLVTFISFYLFSPSFFLISIIFTKHQPIFFFLSNISQIPRLYNTFSTFFFFSPGKYFYNSQSGMGCSSDVFTTENAWS